MLWCNNFTVFLGVFSYLLKRKTILESVTEDGEDFCYMQIIINCEL